MCTNTFENTNREIHFLVKLQDVGQQYHRLSSTGIFQVLYIHNKTFLSLKSSYSEQFSIPMSVVRFLIVSF